MEIEIPCPVGFVIIEKLTWMAEEEIAQTEIVSVHGVVPPPISFLIILAVCFGLDF